MEARQSYYSRSTVLIIGCAVAFFIIGLFISQKAEAQLLSRIANSFSNERQTIQFSSSNGIQNFEIQYQGKIEVTDDDKDIKSLSPGGFLEISKTTFGSNRSIKIEYDGANKVKRKYYEGRREMPFDPEGKKWLAEILPEIVRTTRVAAESRVNRFYNKGGVASVLDEIKLISSDYVRVYYADLLMDKNLSGKELVQTVNFISNTVKSDYYLAELLKSKSYLFYKNEQTSNAYFSALTKINSDYYLSVVLQDALTKGKPSSEALESIMSAINSIESDYYQTVVINTLLEDNSINDKTLDMLIATSKNIESDYYQSSILKKALEHPNLTTSAFNNILIEVSNVSSDYYMATVFGDLLEKDIDAASKVNIINTVSQKMTSDYYLSSILTKIFEEGPATAEISEAIYNALQSMESDYYASSIITSAANGGNLDKKSLLALVKSTCTIDSDYYQLVALSSLAKYINDLNDDTLKSEYRKAAKNINSDAYYGRAIKAID